MCIVCACIVMVLVTQIRARWQSGLRGRRRRRGHRGVRARGRTSSRERARTSNSACIEFGKVHFHRPLGQRRQARPRRPRGPRASEQGGRRQLRARDDTLLRRRGDLLRHRRGGHQVRILVREEGVKDGDDHRRSRGQSGARSHKRRRRRAQATSK